MYWMIKTIQDQADFHRDLDKLMEWADMVGNEIQSLKMLTRDKNLDNHWNNFIYYATECSSMLIKLNILV